MFFAEKEHTLCRSKQIDLFCGKRGWNWNPTKFLCHTLWQQHQILYLKELLYVGVGIVLCNARIPMHNWLWHTPLLEEGGGMGRTNRTGHKASCSILSTKTSKLFHLFYEYFPHPRYLMRKTSKKLSFGPQGGKGGGRKKLDFADFPTWGQKNIPCPRHSTLLNKIVKSCDLSSWTL